MTDAEEKLISIIYHWNPAVATQTRGFLGVRDIKQSRAETRNTQLTTTLTSLLVEAKNQFEHRPVATLERIDRCLRVLADST